MSTYYKVSLMVSKSQKKTLLFLLGEEGHSSFQQILLAFVCLSFLFCQKRLPPSLEEEPVLICTLTQHCVADLASQAHVPVVCLEDYEPAGDLWLAVTIHRKPAFHTCRTPASSGIVPCADSWVEDEGSLCVTKTPADVFLASQK